MAQKLHIIQTWSRKTKTLVSIVLNKVAIIDFQLESRFRWWAIFWPLYFRLKEIFTVICFSCNKVVTCLKSQRRHLWVTLCCDEGQVSQNMTMSYLPVIFNITRWVNGLQPFTTFLSFWLCIAKQPIARVGVEHHRDEVWTYKKEKVTDWCPPRWGLSRNEVAF